MALAAALPLVVYTSAPALPRGARAAALAGGLLLFAFDPASALVARAVGPAVAPLLIGAAATALLGQAAARRGAGATHALGFVLGLATLLLPLPFAVALTTLGAVVSAGLPAAPPAPWRPLAGLGGGLLLGAGVIGWSLARAPLDPTLLPWLVLVGAGALGLHVRARAAAAGVLLLGAALAALLALGPAALGMQVGARSGVLLAGALGLGAGLAAGSLGPTRALGPAALLLALSTGFVLRGLPDPVVGPSTAAWATFGHAEATRGRVDALRAAATPIARGLGPTGAVSLWRRERTVFAELDGTAADPTSRAGEAERFAGTLGACAAPRRERARVAGDDLGLVTQALLPHHFVAIDLAVPDRVLARAHASALPSLAAVLVHPSVRSISAPGPALLRYGEPADVVVQVARTGWTDGRSGRPDRRSLEAIRRSLRDDGVYVLAAGTIWAGPEALARLAHDLLEVFGEVTLWSPPSGADTALFLAGAPRIPWASVERCFEADARALRAQGVASATDLAGHLLAGPTELARLPRPGSPSLGLPDGIVDEPRLPLLEVDVSGFDPSTRLPDGPTDVLRARHAAQAEFFALLRDARAAGTPLTLDRAREMAPGNTQLVNTLVRPHLDRARQALARASREGLGSRGWQEAETALANARLLVPDLPEVHCVSGQLAEAKNDLARAGVEYAACVEGEPTNLTGLDGLARSQRVSGDVAAAEATLRRARTAWPDRWTTAQNLGVLLYGAGRYQEGERLLREAAQQGAATNPVPAAPHLALALLYLDTGRAGLALAEAERAKTLDPGPEPPALAGSARMQLGQYEAADRELRDALARDPDHVRARGELGRLQATRGQYALAAESFKAILERDPANLAARENLRKVQALVEGAATP